MKKLAFAVGILSCAAVLSGDLLACGDKFLVVGRGSRFSRAGMARQGANILVYAGPSSTLQKSLERAEPDVTLVKAGYRPTLAQGIGQLDLALRQGGWDLVVADLTDSAEVRGRLNGGNAPVILPVLLNATGTEIALAKKDFQRILKGPVKSQAFLLAVDDALAARAKLRSKSAD
jgi:hypothetical protein